MASPQTGIFALGTASHAYLEFDLRAGRRRRAAVGLGSPGCASRARRSAASTSSPASGPELWAAVAPDAAPAGVTRLQRTARRARTGYVAAGDAARRRDLAHRRRVRRRLRPVDGRRHGARRRSPTLAHEIVGWPYHHDLDLTGFIDGTENPTLVEATAVAIDPGRTARRGRLDPAAPAVGARRAGLGEPAGAEPRRTSSAGARPTAPSSIPSRRPRTSPAPTRTSSGKIFRRNIAYGTLSSGTARSSSASARDQRTLAAMLESMVGRGRRAAGRPDARHPRRSPAPTTSSRRPSDWRRSAATPRPERPQAGPEHDPTSTTEPIPVSGSGGSRMASDPLTRRVV